MERASMPPEHASAKVTLVVSSVTDVKMDGRVISATQVFIRLCSHLCPY
jgi:hypothetical protein